MKQFMLLSLLLALPAVSMADYGDEHATICYTLNNQNKVTGKVACMVEETGGAGVSVLRYTINGANYDVVDDGYSNKISYLSKKKVVSEEYKTYLRSSDFKITRNQKYYDYFCYKSKHVHFCSKQPNK